MSSARAVFKPAAVIMVIGGVLLIVASIYIFLAKASYAYGALQGLLMVLLMVIIGGFEASSARSVYNTEQGSWRNALMLTGLSALLVLFTGLTGFNTYTQMKTPDEIVLYLAWACVAMAIAQAMVVVLLLVFKKYFMPTEAEIQSAMKKMGGTAVKTVSECPTCREIVEKDWVQCPQCGTKLLRLCANCGNQLPGMVEKCPNCGVNVERSDSIKKSIETLKAQSEEDARPEARSVRFARLGEAYLKAGDTNNALESYRKAIHYTEFDRKRANFMVKMANILENEDRFKEANEILDAALQLDPEDEAGAADLKNAISTRTNADSAKAAYKKGDKQEALRLVDEVLATDTKDLNDVGWIKAESLVAKAEEMHKTKTPRDQVLKVLDEAVRLDPYGRTKAISMRTELAPKEKKKKRKK